MNFQTPTYECDLTKKGEVTNGMVYPRVLLRLASKYQFRCLGGSLGSIGDVGQAKDGCFGCPNTVRFEVYIPAACQNIST